MSSVKHEYYQTDEKIVVSVLVKDAESKNPKIDIAEDYLNVQTNDCTLNFNLFGKVLPEKSKYKITPFKIEISMKKASPGEWGFLIRKENAEKSEAPAAVSKKNWDQLAKEIEETDTKEKKGEEELNDMFKKIYSQAAPDVRKAMLKSYSESGGTVLSTNWNEVGAKKVDVKPPDGCEFRKWNQE